MFLGNSKQTCMSMTQWEGVRVANLSYLFKVWTQTSTISRKHPWQDQASRQCFFIAKNLPDLMHDCMNRRQTPRCENIHLAADVSDKRPAVFRGENTGSSPNSGWIPSLRANAREFYFPQYSTHVSNFQVSFFLLYGKPIQMYLVSC